MHRDLNTNEIVCLLLLPTVPTLGSELGKMIQIASADLPTLLHWKKCAVFSLLIHFFTQDLFGFSLITARWR